MRFDSMLKMLLFLVVIFLGQLVLRPYLEAQTARSRADDEFRVYIEPGTTTLLKPGGGESVMGKVVIDLRNGNIWGFPTLAPRPYPIDATRTEPPVSQPFFLGRFDFGAMNRTPGSK